MCHHWPGDHMELKLRLCEDYQKIVYYQLTNYTRVGALLWFSQEILCFVRWEVFAIEHFYLGNCCRLRDYPQ